ncbi:AbrB family transcriptional regulator [Carnimonas bestiolae]|uniref:AbrB family transcriptional regulator n=1 Tax=Carnimonas bestiolae TaxID=3402172 RepID=UPI003EDBCD79
MHQRGTLAALPFTLRWLILIVLAGIASVTMSAIGLPGGQFIGPMLVAIALALSGISLTIPRPWFNLGQGAIGIMIAQAISFSVLATLADYWLAMLVLTFLTLLMSFPVGILNVRYGGMPGSTAAYGTTPGAASVMVAMAEDNGGDPRVVAAMQYVRVVCVVLTGAVAAHYLHNGSASAHASSHADELQTVHVVITLVLLLAGSAIGRRLLPGGALLGPVLLATPLHLAGWIDIDLPAPLVSVAYAVIGCYAGLRFDRETLLYVLRAIPLMIISSLLLILLCALSAAVMLHIMDTDYLSLYLASSPGGLDSMTIIAMDTHANVGIVASLQILRLFAVVFIGPWMATQIAKFAKPSASDG